MRVQRDDEVRRLRPRQLQVGARLGGHRVEPLVVHQVDAVVVEVGAEALVIARLHRVDALDAGPLVAGAVGPGAHLDRLVSWMSPTGVTVVVVQNRDTACMAMLDHFFGHRFDLQQLAQAFREKHGDRYNVVITLDPAHVETREPASAYAIAEFMLNLLPISQPPARRHVEDYLAKHCLTDGTYRLSVHQDFLQIRSR